MFFKWSLVEATKTYKQEQYPWFSARLIRKEQVKHICYFSQCTACVCVYSIYTYCIVLFIFLCKPATSSSTNQQPAPSQRWPRQLINTELSHFWALTATLKEWREFITGAQHLSEMIVASNWGSDWRRPLAPMSVMQRFSDGKDGKG